MKWWRFSPRSSFARTLLLIVTLLFVSLVTTYLVVLNFAILPSLQQFNKVLAYEVRMLMTDRLQLEDGTLLEVPPAFRREIYRELGISLYTNAAAEESGLRWAQHYKFLSDQMAQQLGGPTDVRVEVNKNSPVVWLKPGCRLISGCASPSRRFTKAISRRCSVIPWPLCYWRWVGPGYLSVFRIGLWWNWNMRLYRSVRGIFRHRCGNTVLLKFAR